MHSSRRHVVCSTLRLHPRHERHQHLHRGDRGDDGAKRLGRDADRLGPIAGDRAVHHRRDRLRALYHGRHWRDDDRPSTARCSSVALALSAQAHLLGMNGILEIGLKWRTRKWPF